MPPTLPPLARALISQNPWILSRGGSEVGLRETGGENRSNGPVRSLAKLLLFLLIQLFRQELLLN